MGNAQKKFSPKRSNDKEETPKHSNTSPFNGMKKDFSNGQPKDHCEQKGKPEKSCSKPETEIRAWTASQETKPSSQPLSQSAKLKTQGNQFFKNGQFGEAAVKYSEAIENIKNTGAEDAEELGVLYSNRAACHLKDGNCGECIEDCDNALELLPFSIKPLLRRAMANESLERYRQAYVDYKIALQIDNGLQLANDSINRITRTLIELDGPNWREKLPPIPSVPVSYQLHLHEKKVPASNNVHSEIPTGKSAEERFLYLKQEGNEYVKKSQYKEAVKKYTECLKLNAEECAIYTNRALCYLKLCQYEAARQDCDCALQRDATNIKALYRRAQANKGLENYQDCSRDLEKVLSLDPGVTEAKNLLEEVTSLLAANDIKANGTEKQRQKILIEEVYEQEARASEDHSLNRSENNVPQRKTRRPEVTQPSTAYEFEQLMNEMRVGKDLEGCAQLLSVTDPKDLPTFLSNKLEAETLVLIVRSLKHHIVEENPTLVYRHLSHLSRAERFTVALLLLGKAEREEVEGLFGCLSRKQCEHIDSDAISNLAKQYGL